MTTWQERQDAKAERLAERAERKRAEGEARLTAGRQALDAIPFGQPILVGHYSERTDRNYRARAVANIDRGHDAIAQAERLERRAERGPVGIHSDDEDAIDKLEAKAAKLEAKRDRMKAANKAIRAAKGNEAAAIAALVELRYPEAAAAALVRPQWGRPGFTFELTNLGATIRETRRRIAELQELRTADEVNAAGEGWELAEDDGRYVLTFSERCDDTTYRTVRAAGFVWSPTRRAFVRKITANGRATAQRLAAALAGEVTR